jgi:hypothetical protein
MKTVFIFILSTFFIVNVHGQSNEFSIHLTSGLYSFGGSDATSSTRLFYYDNENSSTDNPYGRKSGFSYGLDLQWQKLIKSNYLFGFEIGYESLSSKVKIEKLWGGYNYEVSDGKTILTHQFLNLHPYFGKRIKLFKELKTDLTLGLDIGLCLNYKEHATVNCTNGIKFEMTQYEIHQFLYDTKPTYDLRPRLEFINYYKKIGLTVGYSFGLTNYTPGSIWAVNKVWTYRVYSRMIRIGLAYKF